MTDPALPSAAASALGAEAGEWPSGQRCHRGLDSQGQFGSCLPTTSSRGSLMRTLTLWSAVSAAAVLSTFVTGAVAVAVEPGPTELVSTSSAGEPGNQRSGYPLVSADGRYVAFTSMANNLVAGDTNDATSQSDAFVKDLSTGVLERVSVDGDGNQLPAGGGVLSLSANGRLVLFTTPVAAEGAEGLPRTVPQLMLHDRAEGTSRPVHVRDRNGKPVVASNLVLSGNGRYLAFSTRAPLVRGDRDDNTDVYRKDVATGAVRRVSVTPGADTATRTVSNPSISHSGRFIAFDTPARLVDRDRNRGRRDVYLRDMQARRPRLATPSFSGRPANGDSGTAQISAGGRYVAFSSAASNLVRGDTNRRWDVFVRDTRTGTTERVSVSNRGRQANRDSQAQIHLYEAPAISKDGRFVVFVSKAKLTAAAADLLPTVYLRDRRARTTTALSTRSNGSAPNGESGGGQRLAYDATRVVFWSAASDLVADDNGYTDVFVRRLGGSGS